MTSLFNLNTATSLLYRVSNEIPLLTWIIRAGEGGHSNINSLRMLVNKNGIKGPDIEDTMATPFFQIRGPFLAFVRQ